MLDGCWTGTKNESSLKEIEPSRKTNRRYWSYWHTKQSVFHNKCNRAHFHILKSILNSFPHFGIVQISCTRCILVRNVNTTTSCSDCVIHLEKQCKIDLELQVLCALDLDSCVLVFFPWLFLWQIWNCNSCWPFYFISHYLFECTSNAIFFPDHSTSIRTAHFCSVQYFVYIFFLFNRSKHVDISFCASVWLCVFECLCVLHSIGRLFARHYNAFNL